MFFKRKRDKNKILGIRNSRKVYFPLYFLALILIFIVFWILYKELPLNTFALTLLIIFIILIIKYTELHRLSNYYEINRNAFIHKSGLLNKKSKNIDILTISDVDWQQSPWQRLIGFGNVNLRIYSNPMAEINIKNINHPAKFVRTLEKAILDKKKKSSGGIGS